jgi:hypothetical protein
MVCRIYLSYKFKMSRNKNYKSLVVILSLSLYQYQLPFTGLLFGNMMIGCENGMDRQTDIKE